MSTDVRKGSATLFIDTRGVADESTFLRRYAALATLIALLLILPVVSSIYTGSWWIPHNDDWAFIRIAEHFARTGEVQLVGWNNTAVVGQAVVLGPWGDNANARHALVLGLAVALLVACYQALHACTSTRLALIGTATLGVTPFFGLLATSFMTDIPAAATSIICIVMADRARETSSSAAMVVALVVGFLGATVREVAIVAPLSVLALSVVQWQRRNEAFHKTTWTAGLALFGAFVGFEIWRRSLPFGMDPVPHLSLRSGIHLAYSGFITVALFLLPAITARLRSLTWDWKTLAVAIGVLGLGLLQWPNHRFILLPDYVGPGGPYLGVGPEGRHVMPVWVFNSFSGVAIVAGALLASRIVVTFPRIAPLWQIYGVLAGLAYLAPAFLGQPTFDRYVLPLLVPALLICMWTDRSCPAPARMEHSRSRWEIPLAMLPAVSLLCMTVLASVLTTTGLSHDAARWVVAEELTTLGVPATDINAGMEWTGYHSMVPAVPVNTPTAESPFPTNMFSDSRQCYLVTEGPMTNLGEPRFVPYRKFVLVGDDRLWVYEVNPCR